jgi:peptidoglycan/xylan/chitin deacetylase (PgdA/CDA1 family)
VLTYHAVADVADDPFSLVVGVERFSQHVAALARAFEIIPAEAIARPSSAARVVLTFDDGYVNNLEHAAPVLAAAVAPATFFVNTPRSGDREMWWEEITHALEPEPACDFLDLDVGRPIAIDVRTPAARAQAVQKLGVHLETLPAEGIASTLDAVYGQLGVDPRPCSHHRRMTDDEILALRSLGPFEIGGHTPNHLALASLDSATALAQIAASFGHLTGLLGSMPVSFAYPFGQLGYTVSTRDASLVERAGFRFGFTTVPRSVPRRFDPHLVPRLTVTDIGAADLVGTVLDAMAG